MGGNAAATGPDFSQGVKLADIAEGATLGGRVGDEPVLLYFTTSWCGPCRVFGPQLNAHVAANPERLRVVRVDAEDSPAAADRFRVTAPLQALPTP